MTLFLKARWELCVVILLFIASRAGALHYPFYWDESWSYAPAVKLMYLHGPSLMPNAIDLFYSRGHPLFFYAAAATWMKIFGDSLISQHSFSLFVSVLALISVYEIARRMFGRRAGIIALILLPLQVMFFVQSTFLLPEVLIGLLSLLALYFYTTSHKLFTFVCLTALLFTKESGLVMGLVLGVHATLNLFNKTEQFRDRAIRFLVVFLSGIAIGIFFLVQKRINGWYFYPEHTGYIEWVWHVFWDKFRYALDTLFCFNFRFRIFQLLMLLAIIVSVHLKDIRFATPLIPGYLIYVIIEDKFTWLPRKLLFAIFLLSLIFTAVQLVRHYSFRSRPESQFIYLAIAFIISYLCFTCINFFTARYLLCALALLMVLAAAYFEVYFQALYNNIYYLSLACILLAETYGFKYDTGIGDLNLGAFDGMTVELNVVSYCEQHGLYDRKIVASNFQTREHLQKPYTGFLSKGRTFSHVACDTLGGVDFIIFDNIEPDTHYDGIKTSGVYHLAYRTAIGQAWAEIYQKQNPNIPAGQ